jgi:hypothetical protein
VVDGGGHVSREYGTGRGRIDIVVRWPYTTPDGKRAWRREAVELEVRLSLRSGVRETGTQCWRLRSAHDPFGLMGGAVGA